MKRKRIIFGVLLLGTALLVGCRATTTTGAALPIHTIQKPVLARTATDEATYQRLGITHQPAPWEDGLRTAARAGTYEWWYVDNEYSDGSKVVVTYYTRDALSLNKPVQPKVTLDITLPDGKSRHAEVDLPAGTPIDAATDHADVKIGKSRIEYRDGRYFVTYDDGNIQFRSEMTPLAPMWRPATGHTYFGTDDSQYFAWFVAVPSATVTSTLTMDGKTTTLTGHGYHDHNWGNVGMNEVMNHWYWARAQVGPYTIIASDIIAADKYNYSRTPVFMIAKDGKILADDASKTVIERQDTVLHPGTKKFMDNRLIFTQPDGDTTYRMTFTRKQDMTVESLLDRLPTVQKLGARLMGMNPTYDRISGDVNLNITQQGKEIFNGDSTGIWEQMFFGSNREATINTAK